MTCAFFGHRESPDFIKPLLEEEIRKLIKNEGYKEFLVGNQGRFDAMVYTTLKQLQGEYHTIRFYSVRHPCRKEKFTDNKSCIKSETRKKKQIS